MTFANNYNQYLMRKYIHYFIGLIWFLCVQNQIIPKQPLHNLPIYGNFSLGYYYTNLYLGTPPQRQSLILDTGSGIVAMPCQQCVQCGSKHINGRFSIKNSSTSKIITCASQSDYPGNCRNCASKNSLQQCQFQISYDEGSSLKGIIVEDYILVSKTFDRYFLKDQKIDPVLSQELLEERVRSIFGCTTYENKLFTDQKADGILGLSPIRQHQLLENIYQAHSSVTKQKHSFALCYGNNGGIFTIGGINTELNLDNHSYISTYDSSKEQYNIKFADMIIKGKTKKVSLQLSKQINTLLIDSGTTFTYLTKDPYTKLVDQIEDVCLKFGCEETQRQKPKCFRFLEMETLSQSLARFPNITIKFQEGGELDWQPHQYFMVRNQQLKQVCLGIEQYSQIMLGGTWMANKNIYFNLDNSQVEIYKAKCVIDDPVMKSVYGYDMPRPISLSVFVFQDLVKNIVTVIMGIVLIIIMVKSNQDNAQQPEEIKEVDTSELMEQISMIQN